MQALDAAEIRQATGLILPPKPTQDSGLVHFSQLSGGVEEAWLWLFPDQRQALAVRCLGEILSDDDPVRDWVASTIPVNRPGEPTQTYVDLIKPQELREWRSRLEFGGIHSVWWGFDYKRFALDRNLKAATLEVFGLEEFYAWLARNT